MKWLGSGLGLWAALACSALEPTIPAPAVIVFLNDTARIAVADTVPRGAAFQVTFESFGGGCTRSIASTNERVTGSVVEIRPFDQFTQTNGREYCPTDLLRLRHSVTVDVDQPGIATIKVVGERKGSGLKSPAQIQRTIVVR